MIDQWTVLLWLVTAVDWEVRHARVLVAVLIFTAFVVCGWRKAEPTAIESDLTPLDDLLTPTRTEEQ